MRIIEIMGPPRAGKTTLCQMLVGRLGVQNCTLYSDRDVIDKVLVPYENPMWQVIYAYHMYRAVLKARASGIPTLIMDRGFSDCQAWIACQDLDLFDDHNTRVKRLGVAEFQKLAILSDDVVETWVLTGVTAQECQRRHRAAGVHQAVDSLVMGDTALLDRLISYYAQVNPSNRLNTADTVSHNADLVLGRPVA